MKHWLRIGWELVINKPLISDDGERWHITRREYFELVKPGWFYTLFVTKDECGCRRRFGRWHILYCMEHAFGEDTI